MTPTSPLASVPIVDCGRSSRLSGRLRGLLVELLALEREIRSLPESTGTTWTLRRVEIATRALAEAVTLGDVDHG
jgi:hypothetical protein